MIMGIIMISVQKAPMLEKEFVVSMPKLSVSNELRLCELLLLDWKIDLILGMILQLRFVKHEVNGVPT